jgi:hypothetical protein
VPLSLFFTHLETITEAAMKATVKRGNTKRAKSVKEAKRDVAKTTKAGKGTKAGTSKITDYPIAETLRWVSEGEKLLEKWGAIKSPVAKRIASGVSKILSVLEALTELRKM